MKKNQIEEISIDKGLTSDNHKSKLEEKILEQLNNLNYTLNKNKILDLVELVGDTKKFLFRNFTSGIVKGIGIGIGSYYNHCNNNIHLAKNNKTKHSNNKPNI